MMALALVFGFLVLALLMWTLRRTRSVTCETCGTERLEWKSGRRLYRYPPSYRENIVVCRVTGHRWTERRFIN